MPTHNMGNRSVQGRFIGFEFQQTLTATSVGDPLLIPPLPPGSRVTVTAIPSGGGTALVEFTTSSDADLTASSVTWQAWPKGSISSVDTDSIISPVTGLRFTASTAGSSDFEVVAP